jgi:hypothetical protein
MGMTYDELTVSLLDKGKKYKRLTETSRHSAACARCISWVLLACFNAWCTNGVVIKSVDLITIHPFMSHARLRMWSSVFYDLEFLAYSICREKVKRFFHAYAINRHKMTTLTPALHCNDYSPDDNRFDLRPFLYPSFLNSWSFKKIDEELEKIEKVRKK